MIVDNGKYYLYRHIRLDKNEPFYIGIGTKKKSFASIEYEYSRALSDNKRNAIWNLIASKSEYKVEILLESDDKDFISKKEIELIKLYGKIKDNTGILANICNGGHNDASYLGERHIKIKRQSKVSKSAYLYSANDGGFIKKFDTLRKMCAYTGRKLNHVWSMCEKKSHWKDWIFSSEYLGESISVASFTKRIVNGSPKQVFKICSDTMDIIAVYPTVKKASESAGTTSSAIKYGAVNKCILAGYFWSYNRDINKLDFKKPLVIYKIDPYTQEIYRQYSSFSEAAREENVKVSSIHLACTKKSYCDGYIYSKTPFINISDYGKQLKRKIFKINKSGVACIYNKIADAANELSVNSGRICEAIKNGIEYMGYKWKYYKQ
jgi:hypothetical protein